MVVAIDARGRPSSDDGDEHRDQERHRGLAEQAEGVDPGRLLHGAGGHQGVDHRVARDQDERQQQQPQHRPEAGRADVAPHAVVLLVPVGGSAGTGGPGGVARAPAGTAAHLPQHQVGERDVDPRGERLGDEVGAEIPAHDGDRDADEEADPDVGPELLGRGDRPRVGRHHGVHRRERAGGRQRVPQERTAEPARHGQNDREEHDEARVEEDREPEDQGGDAEGERCPLLAEPGHEPVGQHLGAAADLQQPAEHDAERDEQGDGPQGVGEPVEQHVGDRAEVESDGDRGDHADQDQRHERVQLDRDDQHQQQGHRRGGDEQQRGRAVDGIDRFHRTSLSAPVEPLCRPRPPCHTPLEGRWPFRIWCPAGPRGTMHG